MCVVNCSVTSDSAIPGTVACQALLYSGKNTGVGCPSPGALPDPGIEPGSPALQVDSLSTELSGNHLQHISGHPLATLKMRTQVCIKRVFVPNEYIKSSFQGSFSNQSKLKGTKIPYFVSREYI